MSSYSQKFIGHVHRFIMKSQLVGNHKKIYVAVSGGRDSMCLLYVMYLLKGRFPFDLEVLHVNYGTRLESDSEEELVRNFCKLLKISIHVQKLHMTFGKNFEAQAREKRYLFFQEITKGKYPIALAHHINDSMEWSLMNFYKSSNYRAFLGIPLLNGQKIRPFLCVTRKQINQFIKINHIPYVDDSSNLNIRFDRNWTRKIMSEIEKRFKGGEKHYVYRQNELARKLNLSLISHSSDAFEVKKMKNSSEIFLLPPFKDLSGLSEVVREEVHRFSTKSRGRLQLQILKAQDLMIKGEFGPLDLSGGVKIFAVYHQLLICSEKKSASDHKMNTQYLHFKTYSLHEFKMTVEKILKGNAPSFAIWTVFQDEIAQVIKPQHRTHPYWPELTQSLLEEKLNFLPALRLIDLWGKSKFKKKSLNLAFII